jgi:signal transduction histidine kinase
MEAGGIGTDRARAPAERASALKSDFLAKVSHEIRTPMNAIIGFAEVMRDERLGPIGTERYKDYLKDIHTSGEHVISLVNDLLDLSKIEAGRMELTSARSISTPSSRPQCLGIMQPQANRDRVIMRSQLSAKLPPWSPMSARCARSCSTCCRTPRNSPSPAGR